MPLRKQKLHIPLSGGLDDRTDESLLSPPNFSKLQNMTFNKDGAIAKMPGRVAISTTGDEFTTQAPKVDIHTIGAGAQGELYALQAHINGGLFRYTDDPTNVFADSFTRTTKGGVFPIDTEYQGVRFGQLDIVQLSCALNAGIACYVYAEGAIAAYTASNCFYIVVNTVTNSLVKGPVALSSIEINPKVVALGDSFLIFGQERSSGNIYGLAVDRAGDITQAEALRVGSLTQDDSEFDVVTNSQDGADDECYLAYTTAAGSVTVKVYDSDLATISTNGAYTFTSSGLRGFGLRGIYYHGGNDRLYVLYENSVVYSFGENLTTTGGTVGIGYVSTTFPAAGSFAVRGGELTWAETTGRVVSMACVRDTVDATADLWVAHSGQNALDPSTIGLEAQSAYSTHFKKVTQNLAAVANSEHDCHGATLMTKGIDTTHSGDANNRYGAVFALMTPSGLAGPIPHIQDDNGRAYDDYSWTGASFPTNRPLSDTKGFTTNYGGTGYLVGFYTDEGGSPPDSEGGAQAPGTASTKSQILATFAVDKVAAEAFYKPVFQEVIYSAQVLPSFGWDGEDRDEFLIPVQTFSGASSFVVSGGSIGGIRGVTSRFTGAQVGTDLDFGAAGVLVNVETLPARIATNGVVTMVQGGHLAAYDLDTASEAGPISFPKVAALDFEQQSASAIAAPAGLPSATYFYSSGIYNFEIMWKWTDKLGQLHRGPVLTLSNISPPSTGGVESYTEDVVFKVVKPPQIYLHRDENFYDDLELEIYASMLQDGDSTPRFVKSTRIVDIGGSTPSWHFWVTVTREEIANAHSAGTSPSFVWQGELSPELIPPPKDVLVAKSRVWVISRDDPSQVWFSKTIIPGVAPEFNAVNVINVPEDGSGFTGLAEQDDKIILFTRTRAYYVAGDGPDGTGAGAFIGPKRIQGDMGCVDLRSVVNGPQGTYFLSRKGIGLLDRNMVFRHIGARAEDTLALNTNDNLAGAVLHAQKDQVWWARDSSSANGDYILVYDYHRDAFATYEDDVGTITVWDDKALSTPPKVMAAGIGTGTAGRTLYEYDDSAPESYALTADEPLIETGWIKVDGIQGFARIYKILLLIEYFSNDIRVRIGYDYESTWTDSMTWAEAGELTKNSGVHELAIKPSRQKCEAFRLEISQTDSSSETGDAWIILKGMSLEVGLKKTLNKNYDRSLQK